MANTLRIWDKTTNLTNQLGEAIDHQEAVKRYGAAALANKTVVEINPSGILMAIDDLDVLKDVYGIPDGLSDDETLAAIVEARINPAAHTGGALTPDEVVGILTGEVE